jgi:lipopolysaccharide export LptBFGC system permease protein LptF
MQGTKCFDEGVGRSIRKRKKSANRHLKKCHEQVKQLKINTMSRITTPLLNLPMTLITLVTNSSLSRRL